jgi:hypothetical protein
MVRESESQRVVMEQTTRPSRQGGRERATDNRTHSSDDNEDGVGEIEHDRGFGTGVALPSSKYQKTGNGKTQTAPPKKNELNRSNPTIDQGIMSPQNSQYGGSSFNEEKLDKTEGYEKFKLEDGKENFENLRDNMQSLKDKKKLLKDVTTNLNNAKKSIDECKSKLEIKQQENLGSMYCIYNYSSV